MADLSCDVAVIGAGTAGLSAERRARALGAKTLLIDPEFAGTTCATVGCMPSKLLIAAADAARTAREAGVFGISAEPRVDGAAVMRRLRAERDRFVASVRSGIGDLSEGICHKDRASFIAPGRLRLDSGAEVEARATVIATGSRPLIPDAFGGLGERLLTNETLFELDELPRSVAAVGAGPLGLELAQALAGLGVEVTLFDSADVPGGLAKGPPAEALCAALEGEMTLRFGADVSAEADGDGVRVSWNGDSARFDKLLLAVGRPPALAGLNLEKAGLRLDDKGVPEFDARTLQCGDAPVFLAGDVNADRPVLHEAAAEGAIAGENAARFPDVAASRRMVPLAITFSRPELAQIGRRRGDSLLAGFCSWENQGRARVEARNRGAACLYAESDGKLAGAEICAPGAEHLAHLLSWAIQCEMTAGDVLDMPFYHPTLAEGLRPALRDLCDQVSADRPWDRNDEDRPGK